MMSGDKDRLGRGGKMRNEWNSTDTLLRAVEIDSESMVALMFALARRLEGGHIAAKALASAEALMELLDEIATMDDGEEA
jgi:hypothetical protein